MGKFNLDTDMLFHSDENPRVKRGESSRAKQRGMAIQEIVKHITVLKHKNARTDTNINLV